MNNAAMLAITEPKNLSSGKRIDVALQTPAVLSQTAEKVAKPPSSRLLPCVRALGFPLARQRATQSR
jgi:hypothetical protein